MIALLLGSFNPIHKGHIAIARYTLDQKLADEVWLVVSPQNPLKSPKELAPFEDRLEMARLAVGNDKNIRVCDIESALPQPSYTINTLRELNTQYPNEEFVILAGSDIKEQLPQWLEYKEVERLARFLIYPRGENFSNCSPEMAAAPLLDIDSTRCRTGLYPLDKEIKDALQPEVLDYIQQKNLYKTMTIKDYDSRLQEEPNSDTFLLERGNLHYQHGEFGKALNDFNDALHLNPKNTKARQMKIMTESIFDFRHTDIYNP